MISTRAHSAARQAAILIALGANLPSPAGPPRRTCEAALAALAEAGTRVIHRSSWYRSAPVPASDQPWFVNGVAAIETALDPEALLALLHAVERRMGRDRETPSERWAARALDLDLLDYQGEIRATGAPILPHPRLAERAFVLLPLAEVAPDWRHPETGRRVADLIAALPPDGGIERLE